jgi:hypothetical protein
MPTTVEIAFVGLCTFLNMDGKTPELPPHSVIINRHTGHTPFIAFNDKEVSLTGATVKALGQDYSYIELDGEDLALNDDQSKPPTFNPDYTAFEKVARFTKYANVSAPFWKNTHIPLRGKMPLRSAVAGYLEFGGGEISVERESTIEWEFRNEANFNDKTIKGKFARLVMYKFSSPTDNLVITARTLDGTAKRELVFASIGGSPLKVWIGSSPKVLKELLYKEPTKFNTASHFGAFYDSLDEANPKIYVPFPVVAAGQLGGDPDLGFCGPDSRP